MPRRHPALKRPARAGGPPGPSRPAAARLACAARAAALGGAFWAASIGPASGAEPPPAASDVGRSAASAVETERRLESDPSYLWWTAIASLVLAIGGYWMQRRAEEPEERHRDL